MNPDFQHYIINEEKLFNSIIRYEKEVDSDLVSYDLETNSENEKKAQIWGIGLAFTKNKAFYIPWRNKDGSEVWTKEQQTKIIEWLKYVLSSRRVLGHNIIFDALVTENNFGFVIDEHIYADTILMKHTLDEEDPFALKEIAPLILGQWATKGQEKLKDNVIANGGRWTEDQKDMYLADTDILGEYCCYDVMLVLLLFFHFDDKLKAEKLENLFYRDEVMPLYKEVTINMKRRGFRIDIPHFEMLRQELIDVVNQLETDIYNDVKHYIRSFEDTVLEKHYPWSGTLFPKTYADIAGIPLPVNSKTGKLTLAKKAVELQKAQNPEFSALYDHILGVDPRLPLDPDIARKTQEFLFFRDNPEKTKIFNISSGDHIGHLLFNCLNIKPFKFTKGNKPATDKEVLDTLIEEYKDKEPWMLKLYDYRKLDKLLSTYVEGILNRQIDGFIYTSMLQFGTVTGRYASRNPNLQNQPRIKDEDSNLSPLVLKYTNAIKKGFVAPDGYKVVNADYSTLEPRCFAHMSGDTRLQNVFVNGEDLYSLVGIETFELEGVSCNKKAENYLGNIMPEMRQKSKEFVLMIPYGAEEAQISRKMNVSYSEAGEIKDKYLKKFPSLKTYMNKCDYMAKTSGFVSTELGRVRHLKEVRSIHILYGSRILDSKWARTNGHTDIRRKMRTLLNAAKNFPIQGLAAHIVNRAMIAIMREFKLLGLDAWVALQVHDEITCIARNDQAAIAAEIVKRCMETTTKITVKLVAEPKIADNWAEAK